MKYCDFYSSCKEERKLLFKKHGFEIKECKKCGYRYTDIDASQNQVTDVYSDDYFFKGQSGYPNYLEEKDILLEAGKKYAKIVEKYAPVGKVLDVGSAAGFILKGFESMGWDCQGVEPNDTMASYGRNNLKLNITTGSLEEFDSASKYDLISIIEVIGSFYDLDSAMKAVVRYIKEDGLVLVESWDRKSRTARFFGKSWHEYCPPTVTHWFSDKTLNDLFNYYGFELVAKGRPSKKISVRHALSIVDSNTPKIIFKKNLVRFFSRVFGKWKMKYPPFDLKWYLFRKIRQNTPVLILLAGNICFI